MMRAAAGATATFTLTSTTIATATAISGIRALCQWTQPNSTAARHRHGA